MAPDQLDPEHPGEIDPVDSQDDRAKDVERYASEPILCVDDDPHVLSALRRQFRKNYRIEIAIGPERGLAAITNRGPFAVVISDLRMPGMNGIEFLAQVKTLAPDTVRVMLTGQADLSDAIAAVNHGAIFRFLLKPSSPLILTKVIEAALEQHRLILAERQLTQQTLLGCIEVLAEVLSIVEPVMFSRTTRVLRYVRQLASVLNLRECWHVEAAAMLSQIGWITIPTDLANKVARNEPLSAEESRLFNEHPVAAARIIERIPRLEIVAKVIEAQFAPPESAAQFSWQNVSRESLDFGAAILRAAIDLDNRRRCGESHAEALEGMLVKTKLYPPDLMAALQRIEAEAPEQLQTLPVGRLAEGMIIEQDLCIRNGMCLIGQGQQITETLLQRLRGFAHVLDNTASVTVRIPESKK